MGRFWGGGGFLDRMYVCMFVGGIMWECVGLCGAAGMGNEGCMRGRKERRGGEKTENYEKGKK